MHQGNLFVRLYSQYPLQTAREYTTAAMHMEVYVHKSVGHTVGHAIAHLHAVPKQCTGFDRSLNFETHCLESVAVTKIVGLGQGHKWDSIRWLAEGEASADGEALGDVATHEKQENKDS